MPRTAAKKFKPAKKPWFLGIESVDALMALAKKRNLPISRGTAGRRFAKSAAGEGPPVEEVASRLIKEAMHKKRLLGQVKKGRLIPLWEFEARLGLSEYTLHERKDVKKFKLGQKVYITRREAQRLEAKHLLEVEKIKKGANEKRAEQKRARAREKGLQPKRALQPKKKPKTGKAEAKKPMPEQRPEAKGPVANPETMKLIAAWERSIPLIGGKWKGAIMKRLLSRSRHLTPEQFRTQTEPVLAKLMQKNQQ